MKKLILLLLISLVTNVEAGEWIYRYMDSHLFMRKAIIEKNRDAVWEYTHHNIHEEAGILAWQIRQQYMSLTDDKKQALKDKLGMDEAAIKEIQAKDILVSKFFLEAHSYMTEDADSKLTGRDLAKLLQMQSKRNSGVIIYKNDPKRKRLVPYANDYRALLKIPSLENILGSPPVLAEPPSNIKEEMSLQTFINARKAYLAKDFDLFWEQLDCISHSQAGHYADQVEKYLRNLGVRAERLSISEEEARDLIAKDIWALPWTKQMLEPFVAGSDPKYIPIKTIKKGKKQYTVGPFIEVQFLNRKVKYPIEATRRNGDVEYKLLLKTPYLKNLRMHVDFDQNDFDRNLASISKEINTAYEAKRLAGTGIYKATDSNWAADLTVGNFLLIFPNGRQDLRNESNYQLWNGKKEGDHIIFQNPQPAFSIQKVSLKSGVLEIVTAGKVIQLQKVSMPVSSSMNSQEGEALFDGSGVEKWLRAIYHKKDKYFLAPKTETRDSFGSFKLHLEFQNSITLYNNRSPVARSAFDVKFGPLTVKMGDTFGLDWDEYGAIGSTPPNFIDGKHFKRLKPKLRRGAPIFVCGELFVKGKRMAKSQLANLCLPPLTWQTLDVEYDQASRKLSVMINGHSLYRDVVISANELSSKFPISIEGSLVKMRNIRISQ